MDAISDFFGNIGDAVSNFFGNIADWMNDNLDGAGVYAALATVVICTLVGIATL